MTRQEIESCTTGYLRTATGTRPDMRIVEIGACKCVVKDFRRSDLLFRLLLGPFLVGREAKALKRLTGLDGVPTFLSRIDRYAIAIEYVDAPSLTALSEPPGPEFFDKLADLLHRVHERGVVHCDLRSSGNALCDSEGEPWVIDFAASLVRGRGLNPIINFAFRQFVDADDQAVLLLKRKSLPDSLTPEENRRLDTQLPFERIAKSFSIRFRRLTRLLLTKRRPEPKRR